MILSRYGVLLAVVGAASVAAGFAGSTVADQTADFERFANGTVVVSQYAELGGAGQGVVFGRPVGPSGEGLRPVVRMPPAGQAQSGAKVADIATCDGCEFFTPRTTGTFGVPRSRVSVHVGYLGEPARCTELLPDAAGCAVVVLRTFDRDGKQVGESSVRVTRGAGIHSRLSVSTSSATIVGFEITGRPTIDASKHIAIDDLSFGSQPAPAPPDFRLVPAATDVTVEQGGTATAAITIARLNGSTGGVSFSATALPAGVTATFAPNPASGSQTVLRLAAATDAPAASRLVQITGTPQVPSAGTAARSFSLNVVVRSACPQVGTAQELIDTLVKGHKCVYVKDTASIDLAAVPDNPLSNETSVLVIPDGVTLMGGRSPTVRGGILEMSHRIAAKPTMLRLGSNTRVAGLRLRAYNERDRKVRGDPTQAIQIDGSFGVVVENNEIFGWPRAGVDVRDTPARRGRTPRVTRNFFHNNVQCNLGYGVVVGGNGFVLIDRNLFDYNRHHVAGRGDPGDGYVAELNFALTSGPTCDPGDTLQHYNQHFDMHGLDGGTGGIAGGLIEIRRNTIRGAQSYYAIKKRPAFWLRGTPEQKAVFADNAVHHGTRFGGKGAVRVSGVSGGVAGGYGRLIGTGKLVVRNNRLCVDTARELAVGDFNGDGRADVFQSVGTLCVYSPSGQREWHFLRESSLRLHSLRLGDFDGDRKTDVFLQDGARWLVSYGGTSAPTPLPAGSKIDFKEYRFGDFDGDGKTDLFRANGSRFFYSSAGATQWRPLTVSRLKIDKLRFGDFDGDGRTDVFSLVNNQWSVSYGGNTAWRRLNVKLSSSLGSLVFADFNGDRKTDVARTSGGKWQVSWGGATGWQMLQSRRSELLTGGMLFGDFDGDRRADVLQHGGKVSVPVAPCWAPKDFVSANRFRLSSAGARPLVRWSFADMR